VTATARGWAVIEGTGAINVRTITTKAVYAKLNWLVINGYVEQPLAPPADHDVEIMFDAYRRNAQVESVIIMRDLAVIEDAEFTVKA